MIVSISGKIGSGKDTVGKIIQFLVANNNLPKNMQYLSLEDLDAAKDNFSNIQIKKFADKLKDIVCLLIGCTREQLEDREFKGKELGEEWWYYKALHPSDKGKLVQYEGNLSKATSQYWSLVKTTPRTLLQLLGTECGRNIIHPNIWVNALMNEYKPIGVLNGVWEKFHQENKDNPNYTKTEEGSLQWNACLPNWIITDMRFLNELEAVKDKGGISIRVNRPKNDLDNHKDCVKTEDGYCIQSENNYCKGSCKYEHPSEVSLDSATFDFVINNDKDIKHLINEVKKILEKLSII